MTFPKDASISSLENERDSWKELWEREQYLRIRAEDQRDQAVELLRGQCAGLMGKEYLDMQDATSAFLASFPKAED